MPTVVNCARVTTRDRAVWMNCDGCGALVALPPELRRCPACRPISGAGLSRAQVDGLACVECGATDGPMAPAGTLPGWGQVIACESHGRWS